MLVFELEGGARITLRPSGTEPKAKIYVETVGNAESLHEVGAVRAQLAKSSKTLANAFCMDMLHRVGITLPHWALEISDLVSVQDKMHWSAELLPMLLKKIEIDPDNAAGWLQQELDDSSRALLRPGIESFASDWTGNRAVLLSCFQT